MNVKATVPTAYTEGPQPAVPRPYRQGEVLERQRGVGAVAREDIVDISSWDETGTEAAGSLRPPAAPAPPSTRPFTPKGSIIDTWA